MTPEEAKKKMVEMKIKGDPEELQRLRMIQQQRTELTYQKLAPHWWPAVRKNLLYPGIRPDHKVTDVASVLSDKAKHSRNAWVFASGASLMQFEDQLEDLVGDDFVMCSPTNAAWFVYHAKRTPDVVYAMDVSEVMLVDSMAAGLHGVPLICPTTLNNDVVRYFEPNVYWINTVMLNARGEFTHLHGQIIEWMIDYLRWAIPQMGCVTNEMMVILWILMREEIVNAKRVILAGADFSYWEGYARVPKGYRTQDGQLHLREYQKIELDPDFGDMVNWRGKFSSSRMIDYTSTFMLHWGQTLQPIYILGDGLLNEFIPSVSPLGIKNDLYPDYPEPEKIREMCEQYINVDFPRDFNQIYSSKRMANAPEKDAGEAERAETGSAEPDREPPKEG